MVVRAREKDGRLAQRRFAVSLASLFATLVLLPPTTTAFSVVFAPRTRNIVHHNNPRQTLKKNSIVLIHPTTTASTELSGCSVELVEPETGCRVVLLGCFHGSASSAADVTDTLLSSKTDVVVLELCPQRFADLMKRGDGDGDGETNNAATTSGAEADETVDTAFHKPKKSPWIVRYVRMVRSTVKTQGWATGTVAAVLGAVSGLQTGISNLQPGLEFRTAAVIVIKNAAETATTTHHTSCSTQHIVLADQDVDATLQRMGQLPNISVQIWRDFLSTLSWKSYHETFGVEAAALSTALLGDSRLQRNQQLSLFAFLTRSHAAVKDLLRLTLTPLIFLQAVNFALSESFSILSLLTLNNPAFATDVTAAVTATTTTSVAVAAAVVDNSDAFSADPVAAIAVAAMNAASVLVFGYLSLALPATRVVIRERDDILAAGIRAACRQVVAAEAAEATTASKESAPSPGSGRVVAVLGLLHVNGVAQRLLLSSSRNDSDSQFN